jgi:predicted DNA-binding transcriptional regulator AlpA
MRKCLRYADLLALGIVRNRTTLGNWIRDRGFPAGALVGPNTRLWSEAAVQKWLDSRPADPKPTPSTTKRGRGRPRKNADHANA